MPEGSWKLRVEDSVDSPPFALVDDLIVVVRTPRSRDFVTVEVGRVCECQVASSTAPGGHAVPASRPTPWVAGGWCGEIHMGENVAFEIGGSAFRLRLERTDTSRCPPPWACYEFCLERSPADAGDERAG